LLFVASRRNAEGCRKPAERAPPRQSAVFHVPNGSGTKSASTALDKAFDKPKGRLGVAGSYHNTPPGGQISVLVTSADVFHNHHEFDWLPHWKSLGKERRALLLPSCLGIHLPRYRQWRRISSLGRHCPARPDARKRVL
jgi:hypothetical protein